MLDIERTQRPERDRRRRRERQHSLIKEQEEFEKSQRDNSDNIPDISVSSSSCITPPATLSVTVSSSSLTPHYTEASHYTLSTTPYTVTSSSHPISSLPITTAPCIVTASVISSDTQDRWGNGAPAACEPDYYTADSGRPAACEPDYYTPGNGRPAACEPNYYTPESQYFPNESSNMTSSRSWHGDTNLSYPRHDSVDLPGDVQSGNDYVTPTATVNYGGRRRGIAGLARLSQAHREVEVNEQLPVMSPVEQLRGEELFKPPARTTPSQPAAEMGRYTFQTSHSVYPYSPESGHCSIEPGMVAKYRSQIPDDHQHTAADKLTGVDISNESSELLRPTDSDTLSIASTISSLSNASSTSSGIYTDSSILSGSTADTTGPTSDFGK